MSMDDRFVISEALQNRLKAGGNKAATETTIARRTVVYVEPDTTPAGDFQGVGSDPPESWGAVGSLVATAGVAAATATWGVPTVEGDFPITGYAVELYRDADDVLVGTATVTALTKTFSGLAIETPVYFRVRVLDIPLLAPWTTSNTVTPIDSDTVIGTIPHAPRMAIRPTVMGDTYAGLPGDGSATIFWYAPIWDGGSPITGYKITPYYVTPADPWPGTPGTPVVVGDVRTATITGLINVTEHPSGGWDSIPKYYFVVQAVNLFGESVPTTTTFPYNEEWEYQPIGLDQGGETRPGVLPDPVTALVATAGASGSVDMTWTLSAYSGSSPFLNGNPGYSGILRLVNDPSWLYIGGFYAPTPAGFNLTSPALKPGIPVYVQFLVDNSSGTTPSNPSGTVVPTGTVSPGHLPGAPSNVTASDVGGGVLVSWDAPADDGDGVRGVGYYLTWYRLTGSTPPYDYPGVEAGHQQASGGPTPTSMIVERLDPGARYYFHVRAHNEWGSSVPAGDESDISNDVLFAQVAPPPNNLFEDAEVLVGGSGTTSGTNVASHREVGEPDVEYAEGLYTVWYRWVAPDATPVQFSTDGTTFDSVIGIFTGATVDALTLVVSDDDSGPGNTSLALFTPVPATVYSIVVCGYYDDVGDIVLTWGPS